MGFQHPATSSYESCSFKDSGLPAKALAMGQRPQLRWRSGGPNDLKPGTVWVCVKKLHCGYSEGFTKGSVVCMVLILGGGAAVVYQGLLRSVCSSFHRVWDNCGA